VLVLLPRALLLLLPITVSTVARRAAALAVGPPLTLLALSRRQPPLLLGRWLLPCGWLKLFVACPAAAAAAATLTRGCGSCCACGWLLTLRGALLLLLGGAWGAGCAAGLAWLLMGPLLLGLVLRALCAGGLCTSLAITA
jgi:hypothetical protein